LGEKHNEGKQVLPSLVQSLTQLTAKSGHVAGHDIKFNLKGAERVGVCFMVIIIWLQARLNG